MEIEADVHDIASLQNLAQGCKILLKSLLQDENSRNEDLTAKEGHWAMRQYAEFNLWCTKVGVDGQGLRSIDVRLKDVPEICWFIRSLLSTLTSDLKGKCHFPDYKVQDTNLPWKQKSSSQLRPSCIIRWLESKSRIPTRIPVDHCFHLTLYLRLMIQKLRPIPKMLFQVIKWP